MYIIKLFVVVPLAVIIFAQSLCGNASQIQKRNLAISSESLTKKQTSVDNKQGVNPQPPLRKGKNPHPVFTLQSNLPKRQELNGYTVGPAVPNDRKIVTLKVPNKPKIVCVKKTVKLKSNRGQKISACKPVCVQKVVACQTICSPQVQKVALLPVKWSSKHGASHKKKEFVKKILCLVHTENQKILNARSVVNGIQHKLKNKILITKGEKTFFQILAKRYKVCPYYNSISNLMQKMDIIPFSLALAQSALESGWGSSSAAVRKNSCFGHMRNSRSVVSYPNLQSSVVSYMHNLNVNSTYRKMREIRKELRCKNQRITGSVLAPGITGYATVRCYTGDVVRLMKSNRFEFFDHELPQ